MKTVLKSFLSVVLSVLIFLSAFATIATAIIKFKLTDVEYYIKTVVTDDYVKALRSDVSENVTIVCENLEVHRDTVMSFVSDAELKRISQINTRNAFSSLMNGTPIEYERFENDDLKVEIYRELEAFANEHGINEDISQATDVTYNYIIDDINHTLKYFTQDNMNSVSFVSRIPGLNFISNSAFFVALIILVILCILKFLVMSKRRVLSYAYNVSFMLWLASACWFIPVTVIKLQNIASNIAIAYSGFRLYLQNLINTVIGGFFNVSLWAFVISTLLLVASIVVVIIFIIKSNKNTTLDQQMQSDVDVNQEA